MSVDPLPYHRQLVEYLQLHEAKLWDWYASGETRAAAADEVRLKLLKSTYRLNADSHSRLYELARVAGDRISVNAPLTLYKAQDDGVLYAALARSLDEAHIILGGPLEEKFSDDELLALFGHELSHYRFFSEWDQQFLIADQVLTALCNDDAASTSHLASGRLFQLHSEIYCDRGALAAADGDLNSIVSLLVRMETGDDSVNTRAVLKQVEDLFDAESPASEGVEHPETSIRIRALQLWIEGEAGPGFERQISQTLEGRLDLEQLDLLAQKQLAKTTECLLNTLLSPSWMRTETNLNHARLFFAGFEFDPQRTIQAVNESNASKAPSDDIASDKTSDETDECLDNDSNDDSEDEAPQQGGTAADQSQCNATDVIVADPDRNAEEKNVFELDRYADSVREFFCYLLLDFATVDRGLEEAPLAHIIALARALGLDAKLAPIVKKELRMRKKQYEEFSKRVEEIVIRASS